MTKLSAINDMRARSGLGAVGHLLRARPGRIAYVGNSVTAQDNSFRIPLHERLVAQFGHPHRAINAGLGAMGAMGSLFTLPDFVLRHSPDLCLVDCTLGDIGTKPPPESIGPVVEGLLRRMIVSGCAVCILHMFKAGRSFDASNPVLAEYERIANHYQIPSINIAHTFERALEANALNIDEIFFDGIHSTAHGAQVIADLISDAVDALCAMPPQDRALCPPPLHPDHYEFATMLRPNRQMLVEPDRSRNANFRLVYPYLAIDAGNEIEFCASNGSVVGLLLVVGPHSGFVSVRACGEAAEYLTWDIACGRERLQTMIFPRAIPPHSTIHIMATEREFPRSSRNAAADAATGVPKSLKLVGFLVQITEQARNLDMARRHAG